MMSEPAKELRISRAATLNTPRQMRHDVRDFLAAANVAQFTVDDVIAAVSEAVANSVEHGYGACEGEIELTLRMEAGGTLFVEVADRGSFIFRERLPDRGLGLGIIRALTQSTEVVCDEGTRIRMVFAISG